MLRRSLLASALALSACASRPAPAWTWTAPPATSAPVTAAQSSREGRVIVEDAPPLPQFKTIWNRRVAKPSPNFDVPELAVLSDGIAASTMHAVAMLNNDGSVRWGSSLAQKPVSAYGDALYATYAHGVERIDAATGNIEWRKPVCEAQWVSWVVAFRGGVLAGCTEQRTGDAALSVFSPGGRKIAAQTFAAGGIDAAGTAIAIDPNHAWLIGGFSGAYTGVLQSIVTLSSAVTTPRISDVGFAGTESGVTYLTDDNPMFGRQDRYEPVRLKRLSRSGELVDAGIYAPDAGRLSNAPGDFVGQGYVFHGHIYVAVKGSLYQYDLNKPPENQHPTLMLSGISTRVYFKNGVAVFGFRRSGVDDVTVLDLAKRRARIIDRDLVTNSLSGSGGGYNFVVWATPAGKALFDFASGSSGRLPSACVGLAAKNGGERLYIGCAPLNTVSGPVVYAMRQQSVHKAEIRP